MSRRIPFPTNVEPITHYKPVQEVADTIKPPWKEVGQRQDTLMCFEIQLRNGEIHSFPYSDFRGARLMNAGYLVVCVLGMEKYHIVVEGRLLGELARLLSMGKVDRFEETRNHGYELPEVSPHIERITIEALTGP